MRGLIGLLILIADIWAIIQIFKSNGFVGKKILWTLLVLLFPIGGLIIWYFMGPKE